MTVFLCSIICSVFICITGLGAIAAAVMSSTDSAILGSSSMFTHNVYKKLRPCVCIMVFVYLWIYCYVFMYIHVLYVLWCTYSTCICILVVCMNEHTLTCVHPCTSIGMYYVGLNEYMVVHKTTIFVD